MSVETVCTRPPPSSLAAACLRRSWLTAQMLTLAPDANKRSATPKPILRSASDDRRAPGEVERVTSVRRHYSARPKF